MDPFYPRRVSVDIWSAYLAFPDVHQENMTVDISTPSTENIGIVKAHALRLKIKESPRPVKHEEETISVINDKLQSYGFKAGKTLIRTVIRQMWIKEAIRLVKLEDDYEDDPPRGRRLTKKESDVVDAINSARKNNNW
jgi:hypothetical protein